MTASMTRSGRRGRRLPLAAATLMAGVALMAGATPALARGAGDADASLPQLMAMQPHGVAQVRAADIATLGTPADSERMAIPLAAAGPAVRTALPAQLDATQREGYRAVFAAIRAGDWSAAAARLDAMPTGPLHAVARDELYLAKGSPRVEGDPLVAAIGAAPELPEAVPLARLAATRGATALPALPPMRDLVRMAQPPRRRSAQPTRSDAIAADLAVQATPLLKDDQPADAEALFDAVSADLSADARTEWQQRIAWTYFLDGDDTNARRIAASAAAGMGDWAVQADWVAGLAAWRGKDCDAAAQSFTRVAARARDPEMTAAGLFWSARADTACARPERVQAELRGAARLGETFYGLLASGALGQAIPAPAPAIDLVRADWATIAARPNLRTAAALAEVGELGLVDQLLRHQARIGSAVDHAVLLDLAAALGLPATQLWLAQNGPAGARLPASARYPAPAWVPQGGWRVDKALVYAHALQESQFRTEATSRAGARGLMQIMPGTADLVARRRGASFDRSRLTEPAVNIELGQSYLEQLRDAAGTGGLLPKVIAAYNCGPNAVARWNERGRNLADPLLFIEAIPYHETRAYVAIVLRNYWMYQRNAGAVPASLRAMAQGMWPKFPGMPGKSAVRLDAIGATASLN